MYLLPLLYSGDNLIDEQELLELSYAAYEAGNYSPTLLKPSDLEDTVRVVVTTLY